MCKFLSAFIHDNAAKLPKTERYLFGDLRSHSETMRLRGITYGHPDCWREFEWTGETSKSLDVRATSDVASASLRNVVLCDFETRGDLLKFACKHLPAGIQKLDLSYATLPAGLKLPDGIQKLYLSYATLPAGLKLPDGIQTLDLSSATLPAGLKLPDGIQTLYLRYATLPAGFAVPEGCCVIR